jgi:hypothetical protein
VLGLILAAEGARRRPSEGQLFEDGGFVLGHEIMIS